MIMGGDPAEVAAPSEMRKLEARRALSRFGFHILLGFIVVVCYG